jgi:hypothetical protein
MRVVAAGANTSAATAVATTAIDDGTNYAVCMAF